MGMLTGLLKGGSLNGYKTILGYLFANILSGYPLALDAVNVAVSAPTIANITGAVAHIVLAVGVGHQVVKKL